MTIRVIMLHQLDFIHASVTISSLSVALTALHMYIDWLNYLTGGDAGDLSLLAEPTVPDCLLNQYWMC